MPGVTASAGLRTARTLGGVGLLGAACALLAAPAWAAAPASGQVALSMRLPAQARAGTWATMRLSFDNRFNRRATLSVYTGFRDTGLVRAGRLRLQRGWSDGRWTDERLAPGDEEYFAVGRVDTLPRGRSTVVYRLRSASGPGTLRVRVLVVSGTHHALADFRHPVAGRTGLVTVVRPAAAPPPGHGPRSAGPVPHGSASPGAIAIAPTVSAVITPAVSVSASNLTTPAQVGPTSSAPRSPVSTPLAARARPSSPGAAMTFVALAAGLVLAAAGVLVLVRRARAHR